MNDLISIIIPIYNVQEYLKKCLDSIINQTYKNLEIILIDDGSTDNSGKICDEYAEKDKRIKVIHKKNGGVSSARNKGIEISTGKYISFVDSDDYVELNIYELLYKNIIKDDYDVSIGNYNIIVDSKIISKQEKEQIEILNQKEFTNKLFDLEWINGYVFNKLIKRKCIGDIRFNENIYILEDLLFLTHISKNIKKAYLDKNMYLYNYVQRENSLSHVFNPIKKFSMITALEQVIPSLDVCDENIKNKVIFDYLFYVMTAYYYYYYNDKKKFTEIKEEYLKIRKQYFKQAINTNCYGIIEKIKLFILSYFPIIYGKIKILKDNKIKNS